MLNPKKKNINVHSLHYHHPPSTRYFSSPKTQSSITCQKKIHVACQKKILYGLYDDVSAMVSSFQYQHQQEKKKKQGLSNRYPEISVAQPSPLYQRPCLIPYAQIPPINPRFDTNLFWMVTSAWIGGKGDFTPR